MKTRTLLITLCFCFVLSFCLFAACENQSDSSGGDINSSNSSDSQQECIHEFSEWQIIIDATCSKVGERSRKCSLCDFSETEEIEKLSHTEEVIPAVAPTCYSEGSTEGKKCHLCGETLVAPQSVAKTKHNYLNGVCAKKNCEAKDPNYGSIGLAYTLNADGESYSVTGIGTCTDKDIVIPSVYNEKPITSIGNRAFDSEYCKVLTSIAIPDSVNSIGEFAFNYCSELTSITIPNSINFIGNCAFFYCSGLTSITIPNTVTFIDWGTFNGCSGLNDITIPDSVTSIGPSAFLGCSGLTNITIPKSVNFIGLTAFDGCSGLESIAVSEDNTKYHSENNCLIETQSKTLILGCKNSVIPDDGSVAFIGYGAFYGCSGLTSITIPNSVASIGYLAFYCCNGLTSITIPDSVISIGESSFARCNGLTSIVIGNNVTSIERNAFGNCNGLTNITIPDSVTSIGKEAFVDCSGLKNISIGSGVTSIGDIAFKGCSKNLESIIVAEANPKYNSKNNCLIETESKTLILGCKNSIIPDNGSVTSIGGNAFYGCESLTSITIPNSVTFIGYDAFEGCNGLTSTTIPDSVTSIGSNAFYGCIGLTSITIGNNVTFIVGSTFGWCKGLNEIKFSGTVAAWNAIIKGSDWNYLVPATKVVCTDGEVAL